MPAQNKLRSAFTLVEVLMVIALIGVLTVVSLVAMDQISTDLAFDKTYGRMQQIKRALIGDLDANKQGLRDYYGYLGDVGNLPTSTQGLQALLTRPAAVAAWAMHSDAKIGIGWRGPYLPGTTGIDWLKDSWGRSLVYNTTGTPYILSYGSDGIAGGSGTASDIQINLGPEATHSSVFGIVNKNGEQWSDDAVVELYYPLSGALQTVSTTLNSSHNGYFNFTNIPFGVRSFKIFFPDKTDTEKTLGPSVISIDNQKFVIPHNYLDSTPGALPHLCATNNRITYIEGSTDISLTTDRVYFEVDVDESITINTIFLTIDNGALFRGMRIGNDIKNCDGDSLDTGFECKAYDFFDIWGVEDTETDPIRFPEISLDGPGSTVTPWVIPAGQRRGAYIQLSDADNLNRLELRIACDYLKVL